MNENDLWYKAKARIKGLSSNFLVIVLVTVMLIGTMVSPYFFTKRNFSNILQFSAIISIMAVGQFFVVVTGGIDLSVGSIAAFATVVSAVMLRQGNNWLLTLLVALSFASFWGLVNGLLVTMARITPFIATLATQSIVRGCAYLIQSGSLIGIFNEKFIWVFSGKLFFTRTPVVLFVIVMVIAQFFMKYSTFGRSLYAIGGNAEAARLSGIPVNKSLLKVYLLNGLLSGLGGLVMAAQLTQGSSLLAKGYELDTIAAVVVGGASLSGGSGSPVGAVIGGLIMYMITNVMNLLTIPSEPQMVVKGLVIIVAIIAIGDGTPKVRKRKLLKRFRSVKNEEVKKR